MAYFIYLILILCVCITSLQVLFTYSIQENGYENVALHDHCNNLWQVKLKWLAIIYTLKTVGQNLLTITWLKKKLNSIWIFLSRYSWFQSAWSLWLLNKRNWRSYKNKIDENDINIEPDDDEVGHIDDNDYCIIGSFLYLIRIVYWGLIHLYIIGL